MGNKNNCKFLKATLFKENSLIDNKLLHKLHCIRTFQGPMPKNSAFLAIQTELV